ncbi:DnaD domain protein [Mycoplasmatota bacterium WC30]
MDYAVIKRLIEEEIIDFDKLLLKNYKKIGLSEIEAFLLIELHSQKKAGITFISPTKLVKKLTISEEKLLQTLDGLINKQYLNIRLIKEKNKKETEDFSLDNTVVKLIEVYKTKIKHEVTDTKNTFDSIEEEIVELLENQFQKQLKPLEIELIQKWIGEDKYSVTEIKRATLDAIKANKSSISYVDGVLLKRSKNKGKVKATQYDTEKPEALKAFFNSWEKK